MFKKMMLYMTIMNYKEHKWVDALVNKVLDGELVHIDEHEAVFRVGKKLYSVWVTNKWYAYASRVHEVRAVADFFTRGKEIYSRKRPSRKTMWRLHTLAEEYKEKNPNNPVAALLDELK